MKSMKLYGPWDLRLEDSPVPQISDDDLLVKNHYCALCGSDFRNVAAGGSAHGMELPRIMGHEALGEIAQVGKVWRNTFAVGCGVVYLPGIGCSRCVHCLNGRQNNCLSKETLAYHYDGGFAEYTRLPGSLVRGGGVISFQPYDDCEELVLCEPLSCAINAQMLSRVSLCDSVLIVGCGPLGLLHIQLAKLNGAVPVIASDIDEGRLEIARQLGADYTLNTGRKSLKTFTLEVTGNVGVDVQIYALSIPELIEDSLEIAAKGGRVNIFGGMPKDKRLGRLDLNAIHYNELQINGTSDSTPKHFAQAYRLLRSKRIRTHEILTEVVSLERAAEILNGRNRPAFIKLVSDPRL